MSFETEKNKPNNFKIYLGELDLPFSYDTYLPYTAGIWNVPLSPNFGEDGVYLTLDDGYEMTFEETGFTGLQRVGSIRVDGEAYTKTTSISACVTQNKSFYYNPSNYLLYLHFDGFTIPFGSIIRIGVILGFSNQIGSDGAYYDNIYYDPRVLSIPSIKKQKDNLFAGVLQFTGGSVALINSDGYFEDVTKNWNIFGQPFRIYAGFQGLDFDDFQLIFSGLVDDYAYDFSQFKLNVVDQRKFLSRKIPYNLLSTSDYPYLSTSNSGKVKPLAWGNIVNAKLYCLNQTSTVPSTYQFLIADTEFNLINTVSQVKIDNIVLSTGSYSYVDNILYISSGTSVTKPSGDTAPVADNLTKVTASFNCFESTAYGLNVITDILNNYASISTETVVNNYNSTEWVESLANSKQVGVFLNRGTKISDVIKDICIAEDGYMLVLDDGRYTFRHESTTYTINRTIYGDEWLDDPQTEFNRDEFLTSVKILYNQNQAESNEYESYLNDTYESTGYDKYAAYEQKEIKTVLTSTTDVYNKSESVMARSKDIPMIVTRKVKPQHIDLEIGDVIRTEDNRYGQDKEWKNYRIIGIEKNLNEKEIVITRRYLEDTTSPYNKEYIIIDGEYVTVDSEKVYVEV
jgi:hypothetical protein